MSSIAELLKEFSQESSQEEIREENIEEGQVGAEEITVVTDETTTELEEAIEEVAEAVEEQEKVADTTEVLLDAAESLENAVAQIEELRLSGQRVNAVSMKIWARGVADSMEARNIPAEVYQDLLDDFGASFESTDTYSDYSTEAEEKGEGILTKIWNMIKAAFARSRDFLARLIGWFGKSSEAVIKAGYKLKSAAKDKSELKNKDSKVSGSSYGDIADGSGNVKPSEVLKTTLDTFNATNDASNQMYGLAVQNATLLKNPDAMGAGKANEQNTKLAAKKFEELNGKLVGSKAIKVGKLDGGLLSDGKVSLKLELTGGAKSGKEQSPMSIGDIRTLADNIVNFGEAIKKASDDAKRTQGKLVIDFPKTDSGKHSVESMKERRKIARSIQSSASLAGSLRNKVSSAALSVAKKAYVYGMANVRLYK